MRVMKTSGPLYPVIEICQSDLSSAPFRGVDVFCDL